MQPYYDNGRGIVLYLGDALDVLPNIEPASVRLLVTDPPYGQGNAVRRSRRNSTASLPHAGTPQARTWPEYRGDREPFDPSHLLRFPRAAIFGANHFADRLPASPSWIVWDKREGTTSDDFADCELIWTNLGGPARIYRQLWRGLVCRGEENGKRRLHPSQKPAALLRWIIERATEAGDLILDPYAGSGTTLAAAFQTGRRAIGVDVEEEYCETVARRLEQMPLPLIEAAI